MEQKNKTGAEASEVKTRIPLWLYPSTLEAVDRGMGRDNCKSRSEFIENAIRFYAGYLSGEDAVKFLPAALVSALRGAIQLSENHISRLLFKQKNIVRQGGTAPCGWTEPRFMVARQ